MPTTEGYNGTFTGPQIDEAIAKTKNAITASNGGELDMAESLGDGPYVIEFTEETSSGGSGGMTEEEADARYLKLAGGTLTGAVDMGGNAVTNLPAPVNDGDAARKADVEAGKPKAALVSLPVAGWSGSAAPYTQNVTVSGISANESAQLILPMPAAASMAAYNAAGIPMHRTGGEYANIPVSDQACGGNQCLCNRTGGKSVIHNPIIVGESTKGLMKFTARVSYTGSALNKNTLDISASGSELLLLTDKDGRTQIVNPFYVNDVPYVFVTAASARYK